MLKKIVSIFILSQFLMTTTFAGNQENLKAAFDELSYSLTVDWDQKDPAVAQAALTNFKNQVADLRNRGMTDAEVGGVFRSLLGSTDAQMNQFLLNPSELELQKLVSSSYSEGASFVPVKYVLIGVVGGAALIFVAGLLAWELSDPQVFGEDGWNG
jgi:hypothetical protein